MGTDPRLLARKSIYHSSFAGRVPCCLSGSQCMFTVSSSFLHVPGGKKVLLWRRGFVLGSEPTPFFWHLSRPEGLVFPAAAEASASAQAAARVAHWSRAAAARGRFRLRRPRRHSPACEPGRGREGSSLFSKRPVLRAPASVFLPEARTRVTQSPSRVGEA